MDKSRLAALATGAVLLAVVGCIQHTDDYTVGDSRTSNGLLALYTFSEGSDTWSEGVVYEQSGETETNLEILDPDDWEREHWPFEDFDEEEGNDTGDTPVEDDNLRSVRWGDDCDCMVFGGGQLRGTDAGRINNPISDNHAFSIEVWLEADRLDQDGPARIITLSEDSGARNVMLGQRGTDLKLRIRTEYSDEGRAEYSDEYRVIEDVMSTRLEHFAVTFDGGDVDVFRNGDRVYSDAVETDAELQQNQQGDGDDGSQQGDGESEDNPDGNGDDSDDDSEDDNDNGDDPDDDSEDSEDDGDAQRKPAASLGNWSTEYQLRLGNEAHFDRPWLGRMHMAAIYDRALSKRQINRHYSAGPDAR